MQVAAGNAFSLGLEENGRVWSWGQGSNGQLGDGSVCDRKSPILVPGLESVKIKFIGAGGYHAFAVASSGELFAWGKNQVGNFSSFSGRFPRFRALLS